METNNNLGALLPINENNGQRAVNARDLHSFLESKQQFADWMKNRIDQFGFVEGQDYQVFMYDYQGNLLHKNMKSDNQYISKVDYALSIDMAKELSMVERNEKGKQARRYFIACEDKLKEAFTKGYVTTTTATPQQLTMKDKMNAATWAAKFLNLNDASKLIMAQQILAPTGLILPEYTASKGFLLCAEKLLKKHSVNMSSRAFNLTMEDNKLLTYRERQSSSKGTKRFPILTMKGLQYGENQVHPKNQAQTQIRYYEDKFSGLLKELGLK